MTALGAHAPRIAHRRRKRARHQEWRISRGFDGRRRTDHRARRAIFGDRCGNFDRQVPGRSLVLRPFGITIEMRKRHPRSFCCEAIISGGPLPNAQRSARPNRMPFPGAASFIRGSFPGATFRTEQRISYCFRRSFREATSQMRNEDRILLEVTFGGHLPTAL